jgi:hypothetical protein
VIESTSVGSEGEICLRHPVPGGDVRGIVTLVYGCAEHGGRYTTLRQRSGMFLKGTPQVERRGAVIGGSFDLFDG